MTVLTLFWTWDLLASLIPQGPVKVKELEAASIVPQYTSNQAEFEEKYMGEAQKVLVTGNMIVKTGPGGVRRFYFETPDPEEKRIEITYNDNDQLPSNETTGSVTAP